jgi:hypothetical protein
LYLMISSCVFIFSSLVLVKIRIYEMPAIHSPKRRGLVCLCIFILLIYFWLMKKFIQKNMRRQITQYTRYILKKALLVLRTNCHISPIESLLWKAYINITSSENMVSIAMFIVFIVIFVSCDLIKLLIVTSVIMINAMNISLVKKVVLWSKNDFIVIRKKIDSTKVFP